MAQSIRLQYLHEIGELSFWRRPLQTKNLRCVSSSSTEAIAEAIAVRETIQYRCFECIEGGGSTRRRTAKRGGSHKKENAKSAISWSDWRRAGIFALRQIGGGTDGRSVTLKTGGATMVSRVEEACPLLAHETLETPEKRPQVWSGAKLCVNAQEGDNMLFQLSKEAYEHLRQKADGYLIDKDYFLEVQTELSRWVREEVVSWLVDTGHAIALDSATIATAVNCFDRFLLRNKIPAEIVGDVAAACLLIATKVHNGFPPPTSYLASFTDSTPENIVLMETVILDKLQWQVNNVTSNEFIPFMIHRLQWQGFAACEKLVEMLLDVSLLEYEFARKSSCLVAAACVLLASELQKQEMSPGPNAHAYAESLSLNVMELVQVKECLYNSFQAYFCASNEHKL